jgi:hypothetical protein
MAENSTDNKTVNINLTSTLVEKGVDIAKDFLSKLIMPTVEEAGFLLKEKMSFLRYKHSISVLNKTKDYCTKHNIKPKEVPLKLISPFLEYASLEEDEKMQDTWATLLGNMVDSEQNIQNHVFPYLLSQISKNEYDVIEKAHVAKLIRVELLEEEIKSHRIKTAKTLKEYQNKIDDHVKLNSDKKHIERTILQNEINAITLIETKLMGRIKNAETLETNTIEEFEISNLIRLGVVKQVTTNYASTAVVEIPGTDELPSRRSTYLDVDVDIIPDDDFVLTQLGEMFVKACTDKAN